MCARFSANGGISDTVGNMAERSAPSSKLALGTVQFGIPYGISNSTGQTPCNEVKLILQTALANHITLLDTASAYGNAEQVLGICSVDKFRVVSKFRNVNNRVALRSQLKDSLSALRVNALYGYLAHRPEDLIASDHLWEELTACKAEGLIVKCGFSLNKPSELAALLDKGLVPDIIQVPYNYLDRRFEDSMKELSRKGCEIHCRSAFLQGLFFTNPDSLSDFFLEVKPIVSELQRLGQDLPGALLNFVMTKPFVDQVIMGVETCEQLLRNLAAVDTPSRLPELLKDVSDNILMPMNWPAR
jgi:aryl-alcohol dehydrogenase-like predicted oxidoreductase